MTAPIKVLLFDLGGVLVDWAGIEPLLALTEGRLAAEEARRFWLESPAVRAFELGRSSAEDFAKAVVTGMKLSCGPVDFLTAFESWDRGPFPQTAALLSQLAGRFTLACLSNNNTLHWKRLRTYPGFLDRFDYQFVSFEIGKIKPDPEVFEHVLACLATPPEAVVFFDDNIECVEAARGVGMRSFETRGIPAVKSALATLGIPVT